MVTITEAGIVAKIGLNEHGVGVCLNAVLARGVGYGRLPVHVALRTALEHRSRAEAAAALQAAGVAAACHILVADAAGAVGLECSCADVVALQPTSGGVYAHTNHWLAAHAGPEGPLADAVLLPSSVPRLTRADALLSELTAAKTTAATPDRGMGALERILEDEQNFPGSINAASSAESAVETLFGIVMDLANRTARVRVGRPTEAVESFTVKAE
jgi:isopenicillin-N N-acyltransferase-like protein